ncbi:hypothetical protein HYX03_01105 [Candidatus Woesearchaeota archaeon]|nr:hypothetical protein [Candidatus Woesearchaeota archaeon]
MKIEIDTKEDSHEDIKKVIRMLQNIVGDSHEIFTNQPAESSAEATGSAFANIFGDTSAPAQAPTSSETADETQPEEISESTEDLFAELFSEEELKKMEATTAKDEEEELPKAKGKKHDIEFY